MTYSVERQVVDGVWETHVVEDAGGALPAGGTTGQVLTKESDADGDAGWETSGGGGSVLEVVDFDYTDVVADGGGNGWCQISTLEAGDVILGACLEIVTPFDDSGAAEFQCYVVTLPVVGNPTDDGTALASAVAYWHVEDTGTTGLLSFRSQVAWTSSLDMLAAAVVQTGLSVGVFVFGPYEGDGNAGQAKAHTLIVRAA